MPIFETEKSEFKEVLSMKRWLSILAVLGCIVALSGCKNENGAGQAYLNAKGMEVNKEVKVTPRRTIYSTYAIYDGAPYPKAFAKGKVSSIPSV